MNNKTSSLMKRIAIIAVMILMTLGTSARSIHYFTYSQAARTVSYLNSQKEIMIYCGYDYEIETYVLINEIWMERVNSSYYEIWVYGYDAYTGDEIYMPLDLHCVWLYSAGRMYNAAQYLRFRVDVSMPTLMWRIPPYNPYTRVAHRPGYTRSYHYDIHRHGWMPPTWKPNTPKPPLPHYYMRSPKTPAPMPRQTWTPGVDRPEVTAPARTQHIGNTTTATNPSANSSTHQTSTTRNSGNNPSTTPASTPRNNPSTTPSRATTTTPSRTSTSTTPSRTTTTNTPSRTTTTETPSRTTTTNTPSRTTTTNTPSRTTTTNTPSRTTTTNTPSRTTTTETPSRTTTTNTPSRTTTTNTPSRTTTTNTPARTTSTNTLSRNTATQAPTRTSAPARKQ